MSGESLIISDLRLSEQSVGKNRLQKSLIVHLFDGFPYYLQDF